MTELESGFRLSDLVGLVRRRALILVGALVLGVVFGAIVFVTSPASYSATSRVQVKPLSTDPLSPSADAEFVDIVTEQDLVRSDDVAERVKERLDLDVENRTLLRRVVVTSREDSLVLEITYESPDQQEAQDGANAFADAYLEMRRDDADRSKAEQLEATAGKITFTRNALAEARASGDEGAIAEFQAQLNDLNSTYNSIDAIDTSDTGRVVRRAATPESVLSKMALGKAVGVVALFGVLGLGVALVVDRSDSLGGGRRRLQQILPGANVRLLPRVANPRATQAEVDAAIDRLAIELTSEGRRGKATGVLLVSTGVEPPVRLAEDLAASLAFAGIPAVFVIAASTRAAVSQARVVTSFTDLLDSQGLVQPELADPAAAPSGAAPTITWLRPRGSAESSGLLQRAVVEALVTRASRDGFEAVIFLAASPTHQATAAALSRWVDKNALIVLDQDAQAAEQAADALREADVAVAEVVWA
jgi:hypothetical protein